MRSLARKGVILGAGMTTLCGMWAHASDVVVCRVGDGSAALGTSATAVFLERHAADGSSIGNPISLPVAASGADQPFTLGGTDTGECALAVSSDGNFVTLAGYAAAPGTASISTSQVSAVNRVVARVDPLGAVDTTSRLDAAFNGASVRAAVSVDGTGFWVGGNGTIAVTHGPPVIDGGVWYVSLGATGGTQIESAANEVRTVNIFSGQLFGDGGTTPYTNVFTIGSGLPTTGPQVPTALVGMPTFAASPRAFAFFDRNSAVADLDTLYVADDSLPANGGGIQKWTFDGTTWSLAATFTGGLSTGVRGLTAEVVGASVVLYATTTEASVNSLVRVVDDGSASPSATVIATAPTNAVYRGVTLAWVAPVVDDIFNDGFD